MRKSAIYLSLCQFEACPLMPLDAMASGCVIAGFAGGGGQEYATLSNELWSPEDDCLAVTTALGMAARVVAEGGTNYRERIASGLLTSRAYYRDRSADCLLRTWRYLR